MYLAIGRWRWLDTGALPLPHWEAPLGAVSAIDLRPPAQQGSGTAIGDLGGLGLFGFAADPSGRPNTILLTDDPAGTVLQARIQAAASVLGVTLAATRLDRILHELFTAHADSTGGRKPLIPQRDMRLRLVESGMGIDVAVPFDIEDPEFGPKVLAVARADLARIATAAKALGSDQHRHVLGGLLRKYRTQKHELFFDDPRQAFEPLAPRTTYTDDFNRTNANPISTGSAGAWTEVAAYARTPDYAIASNVVVAQTSNAGGFVRLDADLDTDDHYAQCSFPDLTGTGNNQVTGVMARAGSSGTTNYVADHNYLTTTDAWRTSKTNGSGSPTFIGTNTNVDGTNGDTIKLECDGSTIRRYRNGVEQNSVTDTTYTGGLRCGLADYETGGNKSWDDFECGDVGGGVAVGIAAETDAALALGRAKARAVGLASETDQAVSIGAAKRRAVGLASVTETALPIGASKSRAIGMATEADEPFALGRSKARATGLAAELDEALALGAGSGVAIGVAEETDSAGSIGRGKKRSINRVDETDVAMALSALKSLSLGAVEELNLAVALSRLKARGILAAEEFDAALTLVASGGQGFIAGNALVRRLARRRPDLKAAERNPALKLPRRKPDVRV